MSRVVSLTPARLERDSRTLKEATTIARLGHRSTVVEAQRSAQPFAGAPFELLTVGSIGEALAERGGWATRDAAGPSDAAGAGGAAPSGQDARRRIERAAALAGRVTGPLYFLASWLAFNLRTARALPPADLFWLHGY